MVTQIAIGQLTMLNEDLQVGTLVMGFGGIFIWSSKWQNCVALSTAEAEYVAACECVKQMNINLPRTIEVFEDNQGVIAMIKNPRS